MKGQQPYGNPEDNRVEHAIDNLVWDLCVSINLHRKCPFAGRLENGGLANLSLSAKYITALFPFPGQGTFMQVGLFLQSTPSCKQSF
jgi:hypothetical protein